MKRRSQKVLVIQRRADGAFYHAPKGSNAPQWTDDVRLANFVSPKRVRGLIRADWGRNEDDFRTREVVPTLMDESV